MRREWAEERGRERSAAKERGAANARRDLSEHEDWRGTCRGMRFAAEKSERWKNGRNRRECDL